jgi:transposase-like protein
MTAKGKTQSPIRSGLPARFTSEPAARAYLESIQWPDGPICPHCGEVDRASSIKGGRAGLYFCNACRKQFSVTVGTIFERSHIPLNTWLYATHLLSSSKKGISAHQLHRMLNITYKTAWFMAHRIRESMKPAAGTPPLGGEGKRVEIDETYIGNKPGVKSKRGGHSHKHTVLALVERGGKVRSFYMPQLHGVDMNDIVSRYADPKSHLRTDESNLYGDVGKKFASHETVNHSAEEYVRGDASTNTIEGVFSIFKRGMIGVYQHCGEQHLQRYLAEFDFRYSNRAKLGVDDAQRADRALKGARGKRLTYRRTDAA